MLILYHELLESMKPPEFTTLPNLVYQHNGEVSVALVAQAIDGLTRTYGTRFPEDAEPLRADFTAWLAFVGLDVRIAAVERVWRQQTGKRNSSLPRRSLSGWRHAKSLPTRKALMKSLLSLQSGVTGRLRVTSVYCLPRRWSTTKPLALSRPTTRFPP
ncbi:hypothetical protein F5883DRAFT_576070 [Diaporthe sp. PMI_573]|nr:hypothetical protein F5883DRAFT_576070 [Diaporthaceae sp. PMI_573]